MSGTGWPFTSTGCRVAGFTTTRGIVVTKGMLVTSGTLAATMGAPVPLSAATICVYTSRKVAAGTRVTPSIARPFTTAPSTSLLPIQRVTKGGRGATARWGAVAGPARPEAGKAPAVGDVLAHR